MLEEFPKDILLMIIKLLDHKSLLSLALTSSQLNNITKPQITIGKNNCQDILHIIVKSSLYTAPDNQSLFFSSLFFILKKIIYLIMYGIPFVDPYTDPKAINFKKSWQTQKNSLTQLIEVIEIYHIFLNHKEYTQNKERIKLLKQLLKEENRGQTPFFSTKLTCKHKLIQVRQIINDILKSYNNSRNNYLDDILTTLIKSFLKIDPEWDWRVLDERVIANIR